MNFGFLVFPDVEELDFVGPWEMIGMWGKLFGGPENRLIVAQSDNPVTCAKGLFIKPHISFEQCPELDFLLVPGGQGTRKEVDNTALIRFISEQAKYCKAVISVCTGTFLMHRAGLLSVKKATTHWNSLNRLKELGDVAVVEERLSVTEMSGLPRGYQPALTSCLPLSQILPARKLRAEFSLHLSTIRY